MDLKVYSNVTFKGIINKALFDQVKSLNSVIMT